MSDSEVASTTGVKRKAPVSAEESSPKIVMKDRDQQERDESNRLTTTLPGSETKDSLSFEKEEKTGDMEKAHSADDDPENPGEKEANQSANEVEIKVKKKDIEMVKPTIKPKATAPSSTLGTKDEEQPAPIELSEHEKRRRKLDADIFGTSNWTNRFHFKGCPCCD